jgi:hypothetical protein
VGILCGSFIIQLPGRHCYGLNPERNNLQPERIRLVTGENTFKAERDLRLIIFTSLASCSPRYVAKDTEGAFGCIYTNQDGSLSIEEFTSALNRP